MSPVLAFIPRPLVYVGAAVVALWIAFRVAWWLRKRWILRRERRAPGVVCPACGSRKLDDFSDRESGFCLKCKHVWGVKVPR
ncbi:MAG: hypothetical protein ABI333_00070 [bacterium]